MPTKSAQRVAVVQAAPIARARLDFDAVGHYARPDVFRLVVDEAPKKAVEFRTLDSGVPESA